MQKIFLIRATLARSYSNYLKALRSNVELDSLSRISFLELIQSKNSRKFDSQSPSPPPLHGLKTFFSKSNYYKK